MFIENNSSTKKLWKKKKIEKFIALFALRIHRLCLCDRADTILSQDTSSTGKRVKESPRNRCPPIVQACWCTLPPRKTSSPHNTLVEAWWPVANQTQSTGYKYWRTPASVLALLVPFQPATLSLFPPPPSTGPTFSRHFCALTRAKRVPNSGWLWRAGFARNGPSC